MKVIKIKDKRLIECLKSSRKARQVAETGFRQAEEELKRADDTIWQPLYETYPELKNQEEGKYWQLNWETWELRNPFIQGDE